MPSRRKRSASATTAPFSATTPPPANTKSVVDSPNPALADTYAATHFADCAATAARECSAPPASDGFAHGLRITVAPERASPTEGDTADAMSAPTSTPYDASGASTTIPAPNGTRKPAHSTSHSATSRADANQRASPPSLELDGNDFGTSASSEPDRTKAAQLNIRPATLKGSPTTASVPRRPALCAANSRNASSAAASSDGWKKRSPHVHPVRQSSGNTTASAPSSHALSKSEVTAARFAATSAGLTAGVATATLA